MLARPTTSSLGDIFILREVLVEEAYQDLCPLLKSRDIRLVDIGANLGTFVVWTNAVLGVREAFCFEPQPDSFRLLGFNLSRNGCAGVKTFECAVGGTSRTAKIPIYTDVPPATNIYGDGSFSQFKTVPVISFEEWLSKVEGNFDLLKIDCEGAEWEILRNTPARCFNRFQVIVLEVHPDPEHKQEVSEFKSLAEKLGFQTVRWDNRPCSLYIGKRNDLQP